MKADNAAIHEARKALRCLRLEVAGEIVDDITKLVEIAFISLATPESAEAVGHEWKFWSESETHMTHKDPREEIPGRVKDLQFCRPLGYIQEEES